MKKSFFMLLPAGILALALLIAVAVVFNTGMEDTGQDASALKASSENVNQSPSPVLPAEASPSPRPAEDVSASLESEPLATPSVQPALHFMAVGDIMLGRGVESRLKRNHKSPTYPFEEVAHILQQGDIVFGNLEHPVTNRTRSLQPVKKGVKGGKYVLGCKTEAFEGVRFAGFNLLSLANNHILDYYEEGLYDTLDILKESNIVSSGAGSNLQEARRPAIIEKKGVTVGLLAYSDYSRIVYDGEPRIYFAAENDKSGVATLKAEYIEEDIEALKGQVDLVAVSLHWGVEESFNVTKEQTELAHRLIDQGADMVLGHHPHQFQGIEVYKGKLIAYSLGNFIFDQNDPENQESFILDMDYSDGILTRLEAIPIRMIDKMHVVQVSGMEAQGLLKREVELSEKMGSTCKVENDKITFDLSR